MIPLTKTIWYANLSVHQSIWVNDHWMSNGHIAVRSPHLAVPKALRGKPMTPDILKPFFGAQVAIQLMDEKKEEFLIGKVEEATGQLGKNASPTNLLMEAGSEGTKYRFIERADKTYDTVDNAYWEYLNPDGWTVKQRNLGNALVDPDGNWLVMPARNEFPFHLMLAIAATELTPE